MSMKIFECDTCGTEYNTNKLDGIIDLIRCIQCIGQDEKTVERIRYQKIKQNWTNPNEYKKIRIIETGKTDSEIAAENFANMTERQKERLQFSKDMDALEAKK